MLELLGIVILLVLIGMSIGLHEIGHLLPAKKFGVKVVDYAIGFGPTIFKTQRGETRYHIKLIPLGGFIRMIGMFPPAAADAPVPRGRFAGLIEDARAHSESEIGEDDRQRTFYGLSVPKRLIIMTGGPLMNLFLSALLFAVVFSGIGVSVAANTVGSIIPCVPSATNPSGTAGIAGCVDSEESPAAKAGIAVGDTFVSVDGVKTSTYEEVVTQLRLHKVGELTTLVMNTASGQKTFTLKFADALIEQYDAQGKSLGSFEHRPLLGFVAGAKLQPLPLSDIPGIMWTMSVDSGKALLSFPQKLYQLAHDLITGNDRKADGPISVVGISRLSGEVVASDLQVSLKVQEVLGMAASLNLFLFLFNLVPLPPLDGGHAAAALYEGARRRIARLRRKADPGPVDIARLLPLTYVVSGLLLLSGLLVIVADFVAPISLGY